MSFKVLQTYIENTSEPVIKTFIEIKLKSPTGPGID